MVWTQTCWQTWCKEDVWGNAWQKFGVRDMKTVSLGMATLRSDRYGRSKGMGLKVKKFCCGREWEAEAHISLSLSCRALRLSLFPSLCFGALRGKRQILKVWNYVRRLGWTEVQDVIGEKLCFDTKPCLCLSANLSGGRLMLYLGDVLRHYVCVSFHMD